MGGENIYELHSNLLSQLLKIKGLWAETISVKDVYLDTGIGESAAADLSPCLVSDFKGAISYASRLPTAIIDKAISDDFMTLKFNTEKVDFRWFSNEIFPKFINAFLPYRAAIITDLQQDLDDFEDIVLESQRTGYDVDGRDSVFRIHTVNYFDDIFCKRVFGISANEVVLRLQKSIERAENISVGSLLLVSSKPLGGKELALLDAWVKRDLDIN